MTTNTKKMNSRTYMLTATALMTAVTCVLAPMALPIGPVPITLATLAVYMSVYLLGPRMGTLSVLMYIVIGAIGLPVFSGFAGGFAKIAGPTGGYILGYIPMAIIAGIVIERYINRVVQFAGLVAGTAVLYAIGTAWFCFVMKMGVGAALSVCVLPFVPGDLLKMVVALIFGPMLRARLQRAGLL